MKSENVDIQYTKLSDIAEADVNPKDHDIGAIHESMNRFGFTSPLLMNEATDALTNVDGAGAIAAEETECADQQEE